MSLLFSMVKKSTLFLPEIKFLLDENLPLSLMEVFGELGFDVEHVRTIGLRGAADEQIADYARRQKAILVTKDLVFGSLLVYPEGSHHGLLILRVPCLFNTEHLQRMLRNFLTKMPVTELVNAITIAQVGKYRIRKFSEK